MTHPIHARLAPTAPGRHKADYSLAEELATSAIQRIVADWIGESAAPKHRAEVEAR